MLKSCQCLFMAINIFSGPQKKQEIKISIIIKWFVRADNNTRGTKGKRGTSLQPTHNLLYKKKITRRALTISIKSIRESLDPVLLTKTCKHGAHMSPE